MGISSLVMENYILSFLREDMGFIGDLTSSSLKGRQITAYIEGKEDFILAGAPFFEMVFKLIDENVFFDWEKRDGDFVKRGDVICRLSGDERVLLSGERTALNLLQHLSGIATNTRMFVDAMGDSDVKLLDTRKTTPGLRYFEKYATKVGGAFNHRMGLYDAAMIKDNHIKAYGGVVNAVKKVVVEVPVTTSVEVEVESWNQLEELMGIIEKVDIVMLDNWSLSRLSEAVSLIRETAEHVKIEVSGGVTLKTLEKLRKFDIDFISTSKLITSAKWVDIGMEVE